MKQHKGPLSFISELDSIVEEGVSGSGGPNDRSSSSLIKKQSGQLVSNGKQSSYLESHNNSKRSEHSIHSDMSKQVKEEAKYSPEKKQPSSEFKDELEKIKAI